MDRRMDGNSFRGGDFSTKIVLYKKKKLMNTQTNFKFLSAKI
jgi:hypothetical protein